MYNIIATTPEEIDQSFFDYWTIVHFMAGVTSRHVLKLDADKTIQIAILWEFLENSVIGPILWESMGVDNYVGDSKLNIVSDILFVYVGWWVSR